MAGRDFGDIRGFLIDLNGVVYDGDVAVPGAVETIEKIRTAGLGYRFCTNTTTCSVATLHRKLVGMGLPVDMKDIFGVTSAATAYLRSRGSPTVRLVLDEDTKRDFVEFVETDDNPDYVVIGEVGDNWSYVLLNRIFHWTIEGSELLALHRSKYWQVGGELRLSVGSFVAALEYATGKSAVAIGKPNERFYRLALEALGLPPEQVAMIGDDVSSDVGGAQKVGMRGFLVKTGKYREQLAARSGVTPDLVLDSIATLADRLPTKT